MAFIFAAKLRHVATLVALSLMCALPVKAQMQRALGVDATGFKQPVPAFAVTVPQGWQAKGGVIWGSRDPCNTYGYELSWVAMSQDQRYGVAILPSMRWTNSQAPAGGRQCAVMQIGSARDAIAAMVSRMLPQAQMLDYRQRPDYLQGSARKPAQHDLGNGAWMKSHVDAGEALFSFVDDRGNPMRLSVGLILTAFETYMPGGGVMPDHRSVIGETLPAWVAFAPDGELDMNMSEQMRQSIQINPAWQQQITAHQAKINGDNRRTQANIANINRDANAYVSRLSREGHENRMRAMDRTSQSWSDMMNERERWRDTNGSQLNAPMGGANMWRLDNGDYVSTDNHNFNPLASTGQFGTQLQRWE